MGYDFYCVRKDEGEQELVRQLREEFHAAARRRDALPSAERGTWDSAARTAHIEAGGSLLALPPNASEAYREAQAEVDRLFEAMSAAERGYFRLNNFGMMKYRRVMEELGVVRTDYESMPPWPTFDKALPCWITSVESVATTSEGGRVPEYTTRVMEPDEWFYEWKEGPKFRPDDYVEPGEEVVKLFEAHRAAIDAKLAWRPDPQDDFRIPAHKFGSNDGWLVTPEESFFAGSALKLLREAEPERYLTTLGAAGMKEEDALRYFDRWIDFLLLASERGGFEVY